ncbi:MAG: adenylate/guanylate cyclase domain-containing protein [Thiotrichales bacterium]|nr:adenylate/guanylate cyclase domain-containing protein [Thiotrichales bacterium]
MNKLMVWRWVLWCGLSVIVAILAIRPPSWWNGVSYLWQDAAIKAWASSEPVESVVLVDIDEASLAMFGPWPWARSLTAQLVTRLKQDYDVETIGMDIFFPDTTNAAEDDALVTAARQSQAVLSVLWDYHGQQPPLAVGVVGGRSFAPVGVYRAQGYLGNYASLAEQGGGAVGHIAPVPDAQGIVRFMPPMVDWQDRAYPMLSLALFAQSQHKGLHPSVDANRLYPFEDRQMGLPFTLPGLWAIPYRYRDSAFTVVPAWQVLTAQVPPSLLQGKQVIIGASAMGLSDRVATPLASIVPGMMVHAQMLAALNTPTLSWRLAGPSWWWFLPVSLLGLAYLLMARGIRAGLLWVSAFSAGWLFWVAYDYAAGLQMPDIALPVVALWFWLVVQATLEWALVRRQSLRLYQLFKDYLPANVLQQLVRNPDAALLSPQQREVTVLFADIVGFTTMTERLSTQAAASLTRQVLSLLTKAVYEANGTLDKYMGDALMAFWNAPLSQANHRQLAVQAAQAMRSAMYKLNQQRVLIGLAPIRIRIGINTGEVLVGDLGTQWRHAYTVLGDAVNVAQRLMVAAAQLGEDVMIGEATAEELPNLTSVGEVFLLGREKRVQAFVISVTDIEGGSERVMA